jgi:hypothetical protein
MTHRERLVAAARGGETDRPAWFAWQPGASAKEALDFAHRCDPDAIVVSSAIRAEQCLADLGAEGPAVLVEVTNPFGEALEAGAELNREFAESPENGHSMLSAYAEGVRSSLDAALISGADGVLYRLVGASPEHCTPMQFGGQFLEAERELLLQIAAARFNLLFVEGGEGVYLDVVSDLPAHALAWDEAASRVPPTSVAKMRDGAIACCLSSTTDAPGSPGVILFSKVADLAQVTSPFSR